MASSPSLDAQAILLLCARLGERNEESVRPLTTRQYSTLAKSLRERSLRPGDLLRNSGRNKLADLGIQEVNLDSLERLLDRGTALALMVERWTSRGIWILSRADAAYPSRYRSYLQNNAPPILFGAGDQGVLQGGGLAVVGSRNASEEDLEFARNIGETCAAQDVSAISGAAKGIDSESMMAAINHGGRAVGVLAEGLGRASVGSRCRDAIMEEHLTLISPFDPDSRWFSFNAMERNKLIYALADAALVVSCSDEKGGTWSGAVEALRYGRIPVYVKGTGSVANANKKLLQIGGRDFSSEVYKELTPLFEKDARVAPLFETSEASEPAALAASTPSLPAESPAETRESEKYSQEEHVHGDEYSRVLQILLDRLREPKDENTVAEMLEVVPAQARAWLKRAVAEGRVKRLTKPVRYVTVPELLFTAISNPHSQS